MIDTEQKILCKEKGFDAALEAAYIRGFFAGKKEASQEEMKLRQRFQESMDERQRLLDQAKDAALGFKQKIEDLEKEAAASADIKGQLRERINFLEDKQKTQLRKELEQSKEIVKKNNDLLEMQKAFDEWKKVASTEQTIFRQMIDALKTEIRSLRAQMGRAGLKPAKPRKGR